MSRRPLLQYLKVQERWESDLLIILRDSVDRSRQRILTLGDGPGGQMRLAQLLQAQQAMHMEMSVLWDAIGSSVMSQRSLAAAAAVRSSFEISDAILLRVPYMTPNLLQVLQSASIMQARQGVVNALMRVQGLSYRPLAESVYGSMNIASGMVDRIINTGLAQGLSARELAAEVADLIRPDVKGGVSYAAMRLGRTELNNAFHATQVTYAAETPWVTGVKWNLSSSHPEGDECDDYAEHGVYKPEEVPEKPHPQCLCYMTDEVMPLEDVVRDPSFWNHIDKILENDRDGQGIIGKIPTPSSAVSASPRPTTPPGPKPGRASTRTGLTNADKIRNAEIMYGTGSRQHLQAIKRFS